MMSMSFAASCFRMANINSCLRIVDAFSTLCSSAKPSNSTGDLDLRSCSFISRMRVFLCATDHIHRSDCEGEKTQMVARGGDASGQIQAVGRATGRGRE